MLALEMARAVGDLDCVVAALQATTIVASDPVRLIEASIELRDVALQLGDNWSAVYATGNMCRGLIEVGRLGEAGEILGQHRVISERGRFLMYQYMGLVYEAVLALAAGRFGEAEQAAERAHAVGGSSNIVFDAGVYGLQMFTIRREQGRLAEVLPLMRVLSARHDDQAVWRPGLTVLYAELGMIDESRRELDALVAWRLRVGATRLGLAGVPHVPGRSVHRVQSRGTCRHPPTGARCVCRTQSDGRDDHVLRSRRSAARGPGHAARAEQRGGESFPCRVGARGSKRLAGLEGPRPTRLGLSRSEPERLCHGRRPGA